MKNLIREIYPVISYLQMKTDNFQFLAFYIRTKVCCRNVPEKSFWVSWVNPGMIEQPSYFRVVLSKWPCYQSNNILTSCEYFGIVEIIPGGLHHLPKQCAALRNGNGMFDLPEKFSPLLAVQVFYDDNEVICIKVVDLTLKFDFSNGPAGKAGSMPAGKHQRDK